MAERTKNPQRWADVPAAVYDGKLAGDITCPRKEVAAGNDPVANPFLCEEVSNDTMSVTSWGLELGYAWRATPKIELFVSGIWQRHGYDAVCGCCDTGLRTAPTLRRTAIGQLRTRRHRGRFPLTLGRPRI